MIDLNVSVSSCSVLDLQSIVRENNLDCSDKRRRSALETAVSAWQEVQKEVVASVVETSAATIEAAGQSVAVADDAEILAEMVVVKAIEILTSPEAVALYKGMLRVVVVAIAFVFLMLFKFGIWCWERRDRTAVYHWVASASQSSRVAPRLRLLRRWWHQRDRVLDTAVSAWMRDRIGWGSIGIQ